MSRKYTANDFRETADDFENYADLDESVISEMLRQAADMMEREERREKKYEYAVLFSRNEKPVARSAGHYATLEEAGKSNAYVPYGETISFIRRKVGEWEEVKDDTSKDR